ncbi:MAG TPA: hypothetical protein VGH64_04085 [Puia sp.]|jgi:hypothetical protein
MPQSSSPAVILQVFTQATGFSSISIVKQKKIDVAENEYNILEN